MHVNAFFQTSFGGATASLGSSMHRLHNYGNVSIASIKGSMIYRSRKQGSLILLMASQATTKL
eukprot:11228592-Karenia_brevis.AAC.1